LPQVHEKSWEVGAASCPGETGSIFPDSVGEIVVVFVDKKGDQKRCSKIRKDRRQQDSYVQSVGEQRRGLSTVESGRVRSF